MFLPIYNLSKFRNPKSTPKIAEVIYNNDPKMLGRIKVKLVGMYEPLDKDGTNLPWIRKLDVGYGSDQNQSVPNIGDKVCIVWPYDDTHAFYKGIPAGNFIEPEFIDASTEQQGVSFGDLKLSFDKSINGFSITNGNGFSITCDALGNINIEGAKIYINSKYLIDIDAPQVNINGAITATESIDSPDGDDGVLALNTVASICNGKIKGVISGGN